MTKTSQITSRVPIRTRSVSTVTGVGHVRADCRQKQKDDEERRQMSTQNSLTSSPGTTSPPGITNKSTSASGASNSSLRQLTIPSYVLDYEFHNPMRMFVLKDNSHVDRVMVDSGAAHSACPSDHANEHEVREVQRKIQFQTASGELFEHHGEKLVPYMAQDSIVGITYQVTDVEGPFAAVSSMNDSGMTVVFSLQCAWVCVEIPWKPAGCIKLKLQNRTFWMDLPRADSGKVQRMMTLRREHPAEQVERIAGNPAIEEKRQGMSPSADPFTQDNEDDPVARARNLHLDLRLKNWRNMNLRMLCFVPGANIVFPAGPEKIHIVALQHMKVAHQRSCWIGCFSQVIKNQEFNYQCWLFMTFPLVL